MVSLGGEQMVKVCQAVFEELEQAEKTEVMTAIRGGETYQSLWERPR